MFMAITDPSQPSSERLALLCRLSQTFSSSLDLDEVLNRVIDEVIAATRAGQLTRASRSSLASLNTCATALARSTSSPFMRWSRSRAVCAFRTSLAVLA